MTAPLPAHSGAHLRPPWLAAAALFAWSPAAAAQATVHAASFEADLRGAEARVTVIYELRGVVDGTAVAVSLLDFGAATATDLRVGRAGTALALPEVRGAARAGTLEVDTGPDGAARVELSYAVPLPDGGERSVVAHLPVATLDLQPERARPDLFQAELVVPEGWRVTEGFPTAMYPAAGVGRLQASLQVVPSVVTVRARTDGRARPGLLLLLDLVALAGLLGFSALGWRHLSARAA